MASETWAYERKENEGYASKDKLPELKSINLECEDCVYGKQQRVSFSKVRKTPKGKKLELVHTDVWGKDSVPF